MAESRYRCPVCGFTGLKDPPRDGNNEPSFEICICCSFEFGWDDDTKAFSYESFRDKWIADGCAFFDKEYEPPDWDPKKQLATLENDD